MIHFVVHDENDSVGVVVVEGVKAGQELTGWIMDQDREIKARAQSDVPMGHKVAIRVVGTVVTALHFSNGSWQQVLSHDTSPDTTRYSNAGNLALEFKTSADAVDIGRTIAPIKVGEHAHVHNIKTKRW